MKIEILIWTLIITSLFGCTNESNICKKYIQKEYLDSNLVHEELYREGKISEAIHIVEDLIEKDSNNFVAINNLGAYKYTLCNKPECSVEQVKEVYDLYKKSIELCQYYRVGYFNTIEVLAEITNSKYGNDEEIIEYLEFYNSNWKKKSNLMAKGGQVMFRSGRIDEALEYLDEAIEIDSTEAMAYVYKGKCYASRQDWDNAMESLNIGLALDSLSLGFHERGNVNQELGNISKAINDYETAISLYKNRWESYLCLGSIEVERNNIILACQYFEQAKELSGGNEKIDSWTDQYCPE